MKLYTLGTGCAAAEKGKSCSVNVIETGGNLYIFDCGGDVEEKIVNMGLPFTSIKAVFISHMHRDHVQSIPAILYRTELASRNLGANKKLDVFMPEEKGISALKAWLDGMYMKKAEEYARYSVVKAGVIYKDDFITVTAIPTKHIDGGLVPSFAYMITAEGKRFIYTGDLSDTFEDYPEVIFKESFDCVLCELAHFNPEKNFNEIIKSKTKKMIFTHSGDTEFSKIEPYIDKFPFETVVAFDKMCCEI